MCEQQGQQGNEGNYNDQNEQLTTVDLDNLIFSVIFFIVEVRW